MSMQTPPARARATAAGWLRDAERVDVAVYAAIAATDTPSLDRAMARLSAAADRSRLNVAAGTVIAATGGGRGVRAARAGLVGGGGFPSPREAGAPPPRGGGPPGGGGGRRSPPP